MKYNIDVSKFVDDPWQRLAAAIIRQALYDYWVACKSIKGGNRKIPRHYYECETFFKSDYAQSLTSLDLPSVARTIKRKVGLSDDDC